MTGSFSSQEQAKADTNFYDIRLEMVPIWTDRDDAIWLYVEQAASWSLDKPYRQRVYRLSKLEDQQFESAVFTINNPLHYAGAFEDTELLNELKHDSLAIKEGCSLVLEFKEGMFIGATETGTCLSKLRGASYATSEVTIQPDQLKSLDRGYDSLGQQVWGSEYGPYIFKKLLK